jgi:hypothetical protein
MGRTGCRNPTSQAVTLLCQRQPKTDQLAAVPRPVQFSDAVDMLNLGIYRTTSADFALCPFTSAGRLEEPAKFRDLLLSVRADRLTAT